MKTTSKQWVDLPRLASDEGFSLVKQNKSWCCNKCPSCGEGSKHSDKFSVFPGKDGKWRFKCFACGVYGDTADFLAMARNIPLGEALGILDDESGALKRAVAKRPATPMPSARADEKNLASVRRVVAILRESALDPAPLAYLRKRKLEDATIDMAVASGQLRMLPANPEGARRWLAKHVGESLLREAGMMREDSNWPALAFKPLLALDPGGFGVECRVATEDYEGPKAIRYGRMKWPWYFAHEPKASAILVTEGVIDALSAWQSVPEARAVLGVPGVNGWAERWFKEIKKGTPDATILIGFDIDKAGEESLPRLTAFLESISLAHVVMPPPQGKDWNEALTLSSVFI